jgi:hypothetical protein
MCLPRRPDLAVRRMETYLLWKFAGALAGSGLVLYLAIVTDLLMEASEETKGLVAGAAGVVTGLLTALVVSIFDDADERVVGERILNQFQRTYANTFGKGSVGERAVFSTYVPGIGQGWGREARPTRAETIRAAMQ